MSIFEALKRSSVLILIMVATVAAYVFTIGKYVNFQHLSENKTELAAYVDEHYLFAVLVYMVVYIAVCLIPIPFETGLTLLAGFLFGFIPGLSYVIACATAGAVLSFLLSRYCFSGIVRHVLGGVVQRIDRLLFTQGISFLLSVRLVPVIPYFMVNYGAGLTGLPLQTFAWTTALGLMPLCSVYVFAGLELGSISSPRDVLSPRIVAVLGALAVATFLPRIVDLFRKRKN